MKNRTFYTLVDDVYTANIYTEDWSEGDRKLMAKYGEPEIDIGGSFGSGSGPHDFDAPESLVKIMSESPFTYREDARDFVDAQDRVELWATTVRTRISDAIAALRANGDTFTHEEVEEI